MHEMLAAHDSFPESRPEDQAGMLQLKEIIDSYTPWNTQQKQDAGWWEDRKKQLATFLPDFWAASHFTFDELGAIKDPATFERDRFRITPRFARNHLMHTQRHNYHFDNVQQANDATTGNIFLDAPLGYSVDYFISATRQTPAHWEPISVVTFFPDFEERTLFIDQLQNTTRHGEEEHLARKQLRLPSVAHPKRNLRDPFAVAEDILYEVTRRLAKHTSMNVALLKPHANRWANVHDRIKANEPEPYSLTSRRRKLADIEGDYLWDATSFPLPVTDPENKQEL